MACGQSFTAGGLGKSSEAEAFCFKIFKTCKIFPEPSHEPVGRRWTPFLLGTSLYSKLDAELVHRIRMPCLFTPWLSPVYRYSFHLSIQAELILSAGNRRLTISVISTLTAVTVGFLDGVGSF